jgi:hypothetical protein
LQLLLSPRVQGVAPRTQSPRRSPTSPIFSQSQLLAAHNLSISAAGRPQSQHLSGWPSTISGKNLHLWLPCRVRERQWARPLDHSPGDPLLELEDFPPPFHSGGLVSSKAVRHHWLLAWLSDSLCGSQGLPPGFGDSKRGKCGGEEMESTINLTSGARDVQNLAPATILTLFL